MLEEINGIVPQTEIKMKKQAGFTLVEIAIVLVIIGLLLGGVLKGQELINSAKVKNFANDFRNISSFVYAYQDRFRAMPGDDARVVNNLGATATLASTPAGTVGNARINGNWNSVTVSDESALFWQHVRLAGLATGTPDSGNAQYFPLNADGGRLGITGDPVITAAPIWTANFFICMSGIQGRFARQLDTMMDDGITTTGTIRVIGAGVVANAAAAVALTPNDDATLYTICQAS